MRTPTQEYDLYARDEHIKALESQLQQAQTREAALREALKAVVEAGRMSASRRALYMTEIARAALEGGGVDG